MEMNEPTESSSSLRNRAEGQDASEWSRASVQTNSKEDHDAKDKDGLSWAWTLWEVKINMPKGGSSSEKYALVARASEFDDIEQA